MNKKKNKKNNKPKEWHFSPNLVPQVTVNLIIAKVKPSIFARNAKEEKNLQKDNKKESNQISEGSWTSYSEFEEIDSEVLNNNEDNQLNQSTSKKKFSDESPNKEIPLLNDSNISSSQEMSNKEGLPTNKQKLPPTNRNSIKMKSIKLNPKDKKHLNNAKIAKPIRKSFTQGNELNLKNIENNEKKNNNVKNSKTTNEKDKDEQKLFPDNPELDSLPKEVVKLNRQDSIREDDSENKKRQNLLTQLLKNIIRPIFNLDLFFFKFSSLATKISKGKITTNNFPVLGKKMQCLNLFAAFENIYSKVKKTRKLHSEDFHDNPKQFEKALRTSLWNFIKIDFYKVLALGFISEVSLNIFVYCLRLYSRNYQKESKNEDEAINTLILVSTFAVFNFFVGNIVKEQYLKIQKRIGARVSQYLRAFLFTKMSNCPKETLNEINSGFIFKFLFYEFISIAKYFSSLPEVGVIPISLLVHVVTLFQFIGFRALMLVAVILPFGVVIAILEKKKMGKKKMLKKVVWKRTELIGEFLPKLKQVKKHSLENFFLERMFKIRQLQIELLNKYNLYQSMVNSLLYLAPTLASILTILLLIYESSFQSAVAITVVTLMNRIYSPMKNGANFIETKINFEMAFKNFNYIVNGVQDLQKFAKSAFYRNLENENEIIALSKDRTVVNSHNAKEMKKIIEIIFDADKSEDEKHLDKNQTAAQSEAVKKKTIISIISRKSRNMNLILNSAFKTNQNNNNIFLNLKKFSIEAGEKVGLIGLQKSGYSQFIRLILKELVIEENIEELIIRGNVSYLNLETSIFFEGKTLRENIILGQLFDEEHYYHVLESVDLDLKKLSGHDFIQLAENGKNLPNGTLRKVILARFLYPRKDIYIMDRLIDDVSREEREIIDKIIFETFLKEKTVIFVSNDPYFLTKTNQAMVFKDSHMVELGPFLKLVSNIDSVANSLCKKSNNKKIGRERFSVLIEPLVMPRASLQPGNDMVIKEEEGEEDESYDSNTISASLTPRSSLTESEENNPMQEKNEKEENKNSEKEVLKASEKSKEESSVDSKTEESSVDSNSEESKSVESAKEEINLVDLSHLKNKFGFVDKDNDNNPSKIINNARLLQLGKSRRIEHRLKQKGQIFEKETQILFSPQKPLLKFLALGGKLRNFLWIMLFLFSSLLFISGDIWLAIWARNYFTFSQGYIYLLIYAIITVLAAFFVSLRDTIFRANFRLLSDKLNKTLLIHLMNLRLDWLSQNPTSKIFARMTRDQLLIDEDLNTISLGIFSGLINFLVGLVIVNFLYRGIMLPFSALLIIYIISLIKKYSKIVAFLTTEQSIKKTDMYQNYLEASRSFPSMRVNGFNKYLKKRFAETSDLYQNLTSHIFNLSMRWIGIRLTLITTLSQLVNYFLPIILLVSFRSTMTGRALELLLAMAWTIKTNNSLIGLVKNLAMCYARIISLEKLFQFIENQQEENHKTISQAINQIQVIQNSPERPAFVLQNVQLQSLDKSTISLEIPNLELRSRLTAIAGVAGSGRHLLTEVLIGLHFSTLAKESFIQFFGENIRNFDKKELRTKIKILSKKPYTYIGSVDINLDPYQRFSTTDKIKILSYIKILDYFRVVHWAKEDKERDFKGLTRAYSNIQSKLLSIRKSKSGVGDLDKNIGLFGNF